MAQYAGFTKNLIFHPKPLCPRLCLVLTRPNDFKAAARNVADSLEIAAITLNPKYNSAQYAGFTKNRIFHPKPLCPHLCLVLARPYDFKAAARNVADSLEIAAWRHVRVGPRIALDLHQEMLQIRWKLPNSGMRASGL